MDADDEHLLVVGAIEDADAASFGELAVGAPEEVVLELFGAGLLEAVDVAAFGVDAAHDVADGAVFAGGVHALEDEKEGVAVGAVEKLLLIAQLGDMLFEQGAVFLFGFIEGMNFCRGLAELNVGVGADAKCCGVDLHRFLGCRQS